MKNKKAKPKPLLKIRSKFEEKMDQFIENSLMDGDMDKHSKELLSYIPSKRTRYSEIKRNNPI